MIIYDISFIASYYKSIEHEKLDSSIQDLLNSVLEHVNNDILLNTFELDNDNKFKKKSKFKKVVAFYFLLIYTVFIKLTLLCET